MYKCIYLDIISSKIRVVDEHICIHDHIHSPETLLPQNMNRLFNYVYRTSGLVKDAGQRSVLSRVSAVTAESILVFVALGTVGVDTSPLIAAAGVTGATIGFACKDFGANFVASIALSGHPALRTGNHVTISVGSNAVTGVISDWDTRYLYLSTNESKMLCVPNNIILNSVLTYHEKPDSDGKDPVVEEITHHTSPTSATVSSTESVPSETAHNLESRTSSEKRRHK